MKHDRRYSKHTHQMCSLVCSPSHRLTSELWCQRRDLTVTPVRRTRGRFWFQQSWSGEFVLKLQIQSPASLSFLFSIYRNSFTLSMLHLLSQPDWRRLVSVFSTETSGQTSACCQHSMCPYREVIYTGNRADYDTHTHTLVKQTDRPIRLKWTWNRIKCSYWNQLCLTANITRKQKVSN